MTEQELFVAALEIADVAQRAQYLREACQGNEALRQRVADLLAAHERSGEFLDVPAMDQLDRPQTPRPAPSRKPPAVAGEADEHAATDAADVIALLEPATTPGSMGRLGHYEIQSVIGKGGFGVVLKAFDGRLQRHVAIKVLDPRMAATSPPRKRFLREARSAAQIRHQNVVGVYAVDEHPVPYLVMEYIPGETLQQALVKRGPFSVLDVVRVGRQIASGLAAAHQLGLIHRDIKPSNIIVEAGPDPQVKITDFGLARAVDDASLTQSGAIAGTPLYMSPEQALGQSIDQRADLFSLGSVLYVLCTGRPPFRAPSTMAVLKRVVEDQPRPIQEIIPDVPDWLCEIISRLHAKDRDQRFQSARDVAELLARHQLDAEQPVPLVKPELAADAPTLPSIDVVMSASRSTTASPLKTAPRRSQRVMLTAICLAGLAVMLGLSDAAGITDIKGSVIRLLVPSGTLVVEVDDPAIGFSLDGDSVVITGAGAKEIRVNAGQHTIQTIKNGVVLRKELITVNRDGRQVVRVTHEAAPVVGGNPAEVASVPPKTGIAPTVPAEKLVASVKPAAELQALRRDRIPAEALTLAGNGDPARAPQSLVGVLGQADPRPRQGISSVAYSSDGRVFAAPSWDQHIYVRDSGTGRVIRVLESTTRLITVAFGPDPTSLICLSQDGKLWTWNLDSDQPPVVVETGLTEAVLAQSSDRQMIAVGGGNRIKTWNWGDWDSPKELPPLTAGMKLISLAISPDQGWIAYGGVEGPGDKRTANVHVINASTGEEQATLPLDSDAVFAMAFSQDGRRLAAVGNNVNGRIWDTATWKHQAQIEWSTFPGEWHHAYSIAWGPEDQSIAVGSHWRVTLHDSNGKLSRSLWFVEFDNVSGVCLSPDQSTWTAVSHTGDCFSWDVKTGLQKYLDRGHQRRVQSFVVCRDGREVLSLGSELAVFKWRIDQPDRPRVMPLRLDSSIQPQFFSVSQGVDADEFCLPSRWMVVKGNSTTGKQSVSRTPLYFAGIAASSDGKVIAASGHDGHVHLWDVERELDLHRIPVVGSSEGSLAFSPDGQLIGFCPEKPSGMTILNVATGDKVWSTELASRGLAVAFSPNGKVVAVGHEDGAISIYSLESNERLRTLAGQNAAVNSLKFAPDGKTLVSGGRDGVIRVWSIDRPRALQVIPLGPANQPLLVDLDPSGEYLFAAGEFPCIYILKLMPSER